MWPIFYAKEVVSGFMNADTARQSMCVFIPASHFMLVSQTSLFTFYSVINSNNNMDGWNMILNTNWAQEFYPNVLFKRLFIN